MTEYKIIDKRSQQKKETLLLILVALLALSNIKIASEGLIMRHFIDNQPKYELYTAISLKDYARLKATEKGIDPDQFAKLIACESEWKVDARNPSSSAKGLLQYLDGTWQETKSFKEGSSQFNAYASIDEAVIDLANGEAWRWSECLIKDNIKL